MLGHHVDPTDGTVISLAHLFLDLQEILSDQLPLETLVSYAHIKPFEALPGHLKKNAFGLAQFLHGKRLSGGTPSWHYTFELFLLGSFPAKLPEANCLHISSCLRIMAKELRFNICESPSSFLRNKDVPNLEALKRTHISSHLAYACRYWADQVSKVETLDPDVLGMLSEFFQTHFLHWLEIMSILGLSPVETLKKLDAVRVSNLIIVSTMI